jgi:hypothetical protein
MIKIQPKTVTFALHDSIESYTVRGMYLQGVLLAVTVRFQNATKIPIHASLEPKKHRFTAAQMDEVIATPMLPGEDQQVWLERATKPIILAAYGFTEAPPPAPAPAPAPTPAVKKANVPPLHK